MPALNPFKNEYLEIRAREKANQISYRRRDGLADPPHTVCLSVNNNCFMRCRMCDIGVSNRERGGGEASLFSSRYKEGDAYQEAPLEDLKRIVDQVARFGPVIKPNFVEPLLYKPLPHLADYVKSKGLKFYTITNGWLLRKQADWLTELPADLIRVSLDGPEAVHDGLRGMKGSYRRVMDGLEAVLARKKGGPQSRPLLGLCYTISDHNYKFLKEFMDGLHKNGLLPWVYVNFNHLFYTTEWEVAASRRQHEMFKELKTCSVCQASPQKVDTAALAEQIRLLGESYDPEQHHYYFSPRLTPDDLAPYYDPDAVMHPGAPCHLPWCAAQVSITGELGVFGHCILPSFGNVFAQGFEEAWNSQTTRAIRRGLQEMGSFAGCNKCIGSLGPLRGRS